MMKMPPGNIMTNTINRNFRTHAVYQKGNLILFPMNNL